MSVSVTKERNFNIIYNKLVYAINLFIETVTTQRFTEITFVSSSSTLLHVSAFHEAIIGKYT
jgi:hypothetical protein